MTMCQTSSLSHSKGTAKTHRAMSLPEVMEPPQLETKSTFGRAASLPETMQPPSSDSAVKSSPQLFKAPLEKKKKPRKPKSSVSMISPTGDLVNNFCQIVTVKVHSHYAFTCACACAFASNCNIVSMRMLH